MTWEFRTTRVLVVLASTALLSVALPAGTAFAQKVKDKGTGNTAATTATTTPTEFEVIIGDITAEDSTLDADQLLAILNGEFADYADELATLDAARIAIPEIRVNFTGDDIDGSMLYSDIELTEIADGVAAGVSVGGFTFTSEEEETTGEFGVMSATNFNIAALLGLYGLTEASPDEGFEVVYSDFVFEGGTFGSEEFSCEVGAANAGEFRARPLEVSIVEFMDVATRMEDMDEDNPDPALMAEFFTIYADFLTAFESSAMTFDGIDCSGVDDDDRPIAVAVGPVEIGEYLAGYYPAISVSDLLISMPEGDEAGEVSLASFEIKGFDYSEQIAALAAMPSDVDELWFTENWRKFIPAFEGVSLSGLAIDVPNPDEPATRIAASVEAFDLTLGNYVNGVPADIATSASGIAFDLPENSEDEQVALLRSLGLDSFNLGYDVAMTWDEANETIAIETISLDGADLGSIAIAGTLVNAVAELFAADEAVAQAAAMSLSVTDLSVDIVDAGIVDVLMSVAGAEQGASAEQMRPMMAGVAEGMALGMLGGSDMATGVGQAIGTFLRGGESLSLTVTAKDETGVGLVELMAAETDPSVLIDKVDISATAQ